MRVGRRPRTPAAAPRKRRGASRAASRRRAKSTSRASTRRPEKPIRELDPFEVGQPHGREREPEESLGASRGSARRHLRGIRPPGRARRAVRRLRRARRGRAPLRRGRPRAARWRPWRTIVRGACVEVLGEREPLARGETGRGELLCFIAREPRRRRLPREASARRSSARCASAWRETPSASPTRTCARLPALPIGCAFTLRNPILSPLTAAPRGDRRRARRRAT